MPIRLGAKIVRLGQAEFGQIAYDVMRTAFDVHTELGRLFDEKIYKWEMAHRLPGCQIEVPLEVCFEGFSKTYYVDLLVANGAMFELKAVDSLTPRHCGQLLNYLLLADAAHGKVINFHTERVQHRFVNSATHRVERLAQVTLFGVIFREIPAMRVAESGIQGCEGRNDVVVKTFLLDFRSEPAMLEGEARKDRHVPQTLRAAQER